MVSPIFLPLLLVIYLFFIVTKYPYHKIHHITLPKAQFTEDCDCSHKNKRHFLLGTKAMTNLGSILKSRDIILPKKDHTVKYGFSSSPVWMWELNHKEGWAPKNWYFGIVVLEKMDSKENKPVNPRGNPKPWILIARTEPKAKAPILWLLDVKSPFIGKDPDAGKDWRQEEKVTREDEMVGWHHWLNGHDFEKTQGDGEGLGSLVSYSSWGHKESDTTEWLNNSCALIILGSMSK